MQQLRDGELLTVGQTARALGVGECTVRRWADIGRLPALRLGDNSRVFPRNVVERMATELEQAREERPGRF